MDGADKTPPPNHARVLILGGGPSGSYTASCLAREGLSNIVVLEADKFPRYHVGESMIPAMRHFLRFIDLDKKFDEFGFIRKIGAAFKFNLNKKEGYSDFLASDPNNYSWNVVRSEADELMLRHASECGAHVFEETRATEIEFDSNTTPPSPSAAKPIAVTWKNAQGDTGRITFDYLVDATGRRGLLSTTYLNTRKYNANLRNVARWGYWRGAVGHPPEYKRKDTPYFEALQDESGWAWYIPLSKDVTSIGIVMAQDIHNEKVKTMASGHSAEEYYLRELKHAPDILKLIGTGEFVRGKEDPAVRSASDYSYSATSYAGENYRIVGDAAAFIDPFYSSGVHLALTNALSAATTICAAIRNDCSAQEAANWHSTRVGVSYTRFLIIVMSAYRQIRSQKSPILADIDEDNFDRAFENLRHAIQGTTDVKNALTEDELQDTVEYIRHFFERSDDSKIVQVQKATRMGDMFSISDMVSDTMQGLSMRMERGKLGLEAKFETKDMFVTSVRVSNGVENILNFRSVDIAA